MEGKFLVTGATGFIGACLTYYLVSKNKKVAVIARDKKLNWRLKSIASKLSIYECNLLSNSLPKVIDRIKPDYIFHLAAYGTLPKDLNVEQMIDVNIKGTYNLINAAKKFKLFINTGSSSEYGIKNKPISEDDALLPVNDYGVTKASATMLCNRIAKSEKLPIITLRLFSPYGYFEEKDRLIPSIMLSILNKKVVKLSSPYSVRDFVFIDDVINAYMKAAEMKHRPGDIFNVGSGKQASIQNIMDIVSKILTSEINSSLLQAKRYSGSRLKIAWGSIPKQKRQIEPQKWQANISKAKKILDWQPQNDLYIGLTKTFEWFKQNKKLYEK